MTNASPFSTSRREFIDLLATGLALTSFSAPGAFAEASSSLRQQEKRIG